MFEAELRTTLHQDTLLARFLLEYYDTQVGIPPLVCVHTEVADADLIAGFLCQRRGAAVEVRVAERGDKRRVVAMALRNAELGVHHDVLRAQRTRTRRIEGLEELREALNLEALPIRIECFGASASGTRADRTTSARWPRPSRGASSGTGASTRTATTAASRRSRTCS